MNNNENPSERLSLRWQDAEVVRKHNYSILKYERIEDCKVYAVYEVYIVCPGCYAQTYYRIVHRTKAGNAASFYFRQKSSVIAFCAKYSKQHTMPFWYKLRHSDYPCATLEAVMMQLNDNKIKVLSPTYFYPH